MNSSDKANSHPSEMPDRADAATVLAREAGVPFQLPGANAPGVDPLVEWLGLMEVVQMLCPTWPVRDKPMVGDQWRL